jgi:hypothetical protein
MATALDQAGRWHKATSVRATSVIYIERRESNNGRTALAEGTGMRVSDLFAGGKARLKKEQT